MREPVISAPFRVFISYSRQDAEMADAVVADLEARGFEVTIDRRDLPFGEEWQAELRDFILGSDTVIWLVSPASIGSRWVNWELGEVQRAGKRLMPVVIKHTPPDTLPDTLGKLHLLPAEGIYDPASHLDALVNALETDSAWLKQHSRLADRARDWVAAGKKPDRLLRGSALRAAADWRARQPKTAPQPSSDILELLVASEQSATRRQRMWIGGVVIIAVATSVLAAFAFLQRQEAIQNQMEAQQTLATSDFINGTRLFLEPNTAHEGLTLLARAASLENTPRALIRLTASAQQKAFWVKGPAPEAEPITNQFNLPPQYARFTIDGKSFNTISHAASANGQRIAVSVSDGEMHPDIRVAVFERNQKLIDWFIPENESGQWLYDLRVALSPDGRFLATERQDWRSASYIQVYDLSSSKPIGQPVRTTGLISATQHRGFRVVRFLSNQPFGFTNPAQCYLLVGSERGDAAIYSIDDRDTQLLFKHQHSEEIVTAAVGGKKGQEIFVSFDAGFTGKVSDVNRDPSAHPDIQAEFAPRRIAIAEDGSVISLFGADGEAAQFLLITPQRHAAALGVAARSGPLPSTNSAPPKPYCQFSDEREAVSERAVQFFASHGQSVTLDGKSLTIMDTTGALIASRVFRWPIVAVCTTGTNDALAVAFDNLNVEIWRADLSKQIGTRIKQLSYFKRTRRPDQFLSAQLSKDKRKILTVTHFWDPPNLAYYWISLYDISTGLPLIEILEYFDVGSSATGHINFGILSNDGSRILLGDGPSDAAFEPDSEMLLLPKLEAKTRLIAHMARIAKRLPPSPAKK